MCDVYVNCDYAADNATVHIRRRRWKDETGHNVILNIYPIAAEDTRYSEEFAAF